VLENLIKSHLVTVAGLVLFSAALPALLPNMRPGLKSAIKAGIDLLTESELEAEAELIDSLIAMTMRGIQQDFSKSATEPELQEAVQKRVHHFKREANTRARRWAADQHDHHARYRRHLARLESSLAKRKESTKSRQQCILDYAVAALASEA
jgi:hypothetical protein